MVTARRAVAAPAPVGVTFGSLGFYSGGFGVPEGDYALRLRTMMYQPTRKDGSAAGAAFLAVNIEAFSPDGNVLEEAVSMGKGMTKSFVPTPDGLGIVAIPGTSGGGSGNTNWWFLLKSLHDCGLPEGIFDNDLSVLDGTHVHLQRIPEPEDRKKLRASTGEAQEQGSSSGDRTMPVVTEIKEDGKPWEGTGGLPDESAPATPAARTAPKGVLTAPKPVAVKPTAVRRPVAAPAPPPPAEATDMTEDDVAQAALQGATAVIETKPQGCPKVALRTGTFQAVQKTYGDDMAQAVQETYFTSDENLNVLLGQLGYKVKGIQVVPE